MPLRRKARVQRPIVAAPDIVVVDGGRVGHDPHPGQPARDARDHDCTAVFAEPAPARMFTDHRTPGGQWCRWSRVSVPADYPDDTLCPADCPSSGTRATTGRDAPGATARADG